MDKLDIAIRATEIFGNEIQKIVAIEELSELQKELCKSFRRNVDNRDEIIDEISDVLNMIDQLLVMYHISSIELETHRDVKLLRLCKKMENYE